MTVRTADARWEGDLKSGKGNLKLQSGTFDGPYSFQARFGPGGGATNPEELLAAAHAGCFTMALSAQLTQAGHPPTRLHTTAKVRLDQVPGGFQIGRIDLLLDGEVPGVDDVTFQKLAAEAKANCPLSKALAAVPEIHLTATPDAGGRGADVLTAALAALVLAVAPAAPRTYCNPLDLDYGYCPIPDFVKHGKHRATADPVIVPFRGDYYLFSTNQWGYWWSRDLARWTFVPRKFLKPEHKVYDELCAPAAFVLDDALYLIGSTYTKDFPLYKSTDPKAGVWTEAVPAFQAGAWDPAFLVDGERLYLYHGSSNTFPLYGQEVDCKTLQPVGERVELLKLDDARHGWERFGEANDNTFLRPFVEGAWVTKHKGRYYLQYGAPGTEFSGYADGVAVGDKPLGPFTRQAHNPFAYKPGGFARGAGHGNTFQDNQGRWWHTSTVVIGVKNNFERRLGLWPAGFDADGVLFCNTAYGDYPHTLDGQFAGWMLLNHAKPVRTSSTFGGFAPNLAVDEDIKTYWSAATGDPGEWFETDLGAVCTVRAVQVNYADQGAELMGKVPGLFHQYRLLASADGKDWRVVVDKSRNRTDVPHDYVELPEPVEARFLRIENVHVPTGTFALSGLRVFGHGKGAKPPAVEGLVVLRGDSERRNAWLKWPAVPAATGYVVYAGVAPDKLYTSVIVYGANELYFRAMDRDRGYFFRIEAFNEAGVSDRSAVVEAK